MGAQFGTAIGAGTTPPGQTPSYPGVARNPTPQSAPSTPSGPFAPGGFADKAQAAIKTATAAKGFRGSPPGAQTPAYGSQSGPGILGQWFDQRAGGTDPGWQYAMGRATDQINNQYAARGGYNSSGALQSLGDMYANATSQREGQLDTLAAGASTEHQNQLNGMFNQGTQIANGVSGATQPYGTAGGQALGDQTMNNMNLVLGKAGVDQQKAAAEMGVVSNGVGAGAGLLGNLFKGGGAAALAA